MGKVQMPDGKKMACCFCFDIDAMALWLGFFRSPTANPLSRGEFGSPGGHAAYPGHPR